MKGAVGMKCEEGKDKQAVGVRSMRWDGSWGKERGGGGRQEEEGK